MDIRFMQWMDTVFGVPLAIFSRFSFSPLRFFGRSNVSTEEDKKRILVLKFVGMGSVLLTLPLINALKESGKNVVYVTFKNQEELLRLSGLPDAIWSVQSTFWSFPFSVFKILWRCRKNRFAVCLDLEPTSYFSALFSFWACKGIRVGLTCNKKLREKLATNWISVSANRHISEHYLRMAEYCGVKSVKGNAVDKFLNSKKDSVHLGGADRKNLSKDILRIAININTSGISRELRSWPLGHWKMLCTRLLNHRNVHLIFIGGREDILRVGELRQTFRENVRVVDASGKTEMLDLIKLLRECHLLVSPDSGPMHLAAWLGIPVVALFGPEMPSLYGPLSGVGSVFWKAMPCSPCCTLMTHRRSVCKDNVCMKEIHPEDVYQSIMERLKSYTPTAFSEDFDKKVLPRWVPHLEATE